MRRLISSYSTHPLAPAAIALTAAAALSIPVASQAGVRHSAAGAGTRSAAVRLARRGDFNGDGFTDLAAGAPYSGASDQGAVVVAYGSSTGIVSGGTKTWTLDSPGVPGASAPSDRLGTALTSADFNRDGYADLVIGVPFRTVGGHLSSGEILILRGSAGGLTSTKAVALTEDSARVPGVSRSNELFGAALATGRFDGDSWPDLAVSANGKTVKGDSAAGAVDILYGGPKGLGSGGSRVFTRATPGVTGDPAAGANFGTGLASGNLGRGSASDLAVGAFAEDVGSTHSAGTVTVLYGSPKGLRAQGSQRWTPRSVGAPHPFQTYQDLGWSEAIADFGKSKEGDLAIGAPRTNVGPASGAGTVFVLYGGPNGVTAAGRSRLTEATPGVPGAPGDGDRMGAALAGANLDRSGRDDLAIGTPELDGTSGDNAGGTFVVAGGPNGVSPSNTKLFTGVQLVGHDTVLNMASGAALSTGNFGRGPAPDLAIGIPGEEAGGTSGAGAVAILFGRSQGLSNSHKQLIDRDTLSGFGSGAMTVGLSLVDSAHVLD